MSRLLIMLLGLGALGGGAYFLYLQRNPLPVAATTIPQPPEIKPDSVVSKPTVPDFNRTESDPLVRELLARVSADSKHGAWLEEVEGIVEQFAFAVRNIADRESPREALRFLAPKGSFQVFKRRGRTFIAPQSFARYDHVKDIVTSISVPEAMMLWRELKPIMDHAFWSNSRPGERFEQILAEAIDHLLKVPVPDRIEVYKEPHIRGIYTFADPALEKLSTPQKHLLRMGPHNARAIQSQLRELQEALKLSANPAPFDCPPGARQAMEQLGWSAGDHFSLKADERGPDSGAHFYRQGPVVGIVPDDATGAPNQVHKVPPGTRFFGRVHVVQAKTKASDPGEITAVYEWARLPDQKKVPVCFMVGGNGTVPIQEFTLDDTAKSPSITMGRVIHHWP